MRSVLMWILVGFGCEAPTSSLDGALWIEPLQRTSSEDWVVLEDGPLWLLLGPEGGSHALVSVGVEGFASSDLEVDVEFRGRRYRGDLDLSREDLRERVVIPVCPPFPGTDDPTATNAPLTMTVLDRSGASASAQVLVTPTCAEDEYADFCRRTCALD